MTELKLIFVVFANVLQSSRANMLAIEAPPLNASDWHSLVFSHQSFFFTCCYSNAQNYTSSIMSTRWQEFLLPVVG